MPYLSDDAYIVFSRVMLAYPLKKIKDMLGLNAGFETINISYLNPKLIEKQEYKAVFKNSINDIKNYHENIRFIITGKDILTVKNILGKKGFTDHIAFLIEIIKKSAAGLSVLTGKKVNSVITASEFDNAYSLGHEEKFLIFDYRIKIGSFPPFMISQIAHEALIERIKRDFLTKVNLDIAYINIIKFFMQGFIEFFNAVQGGSYYFYPVKTELSGKISLDGYEKDKFYEYTLTNDKEKILFYLYCGFDPSAFQNIESGEFKNADFKKYLLDMIKSSLFKRLIILKNEKYYINVIQKSFDEGQMIPDNCLISEFILQKNGDGACPECSFLLIMPQELIFFIYNAIFNRNLKFMSMQQLKQALEEIDLFIKKKFGSDLHNFKYRQKKDLRLDPLKDLK